MEGINYKFEETATEKLLSNSWIYSGILRMARAFASVELKLQKKTKRGWIDTPRHKIQRLLNDPSPEEPLFNLLERWALDLHLTGNAYWVDEGHYFLPATKEDLTDKDAKIIHWQFTNPSDRSSGLSPIAAMSEALASERLAKTRMEKELKGNMRTILLSDKLSREQAREAPRIVRDNWRPEDGPSPSVVSGAVGMFDGAKESSLESRRFSREEIAAMLGIPVVLFNVKGLSRDELDSAKLMMWDEKIIPLLTLFCRGLQHYLLKKYKMKAGHWRIVPDLSEVRVLQEAEKNLQLDKVSAESNRLRAEAYERLIGNGVSEKRAAEETGLKYRPSLFKHAWSIICWTIFFLILARYFEVI